MPGGPESGGSGLYDEEGRVENPQIAQEMASVEKPYRETKRFGLFRPHPETIKAGENAAVKHGENVIEQNERDLRRVEYDKKIDEQVEELKSCEFETGDGLNVSNAWHGFWWVTSFRGNLGGHELAFQSDGENKNATLDGEVISRGQLEAIFEHYEEAMVKTLEEKEYEKRRQEEAARKQKSEEEAAKWEKREKEIAEIEKKTQPAVDEVLGKKE